MIVFKNLHDLIREDLDFDSVKNIIGDSKQVMVYGWNHCHYIAITSALEFSKESFLEKVFNFQVGDECALNTETLEGREIEKLTVHIKPEKRTHRISKNGITNLLLENYKRIKKCEKIIPLVFCLDADGNIYDINSDTLTSKHAYLNNLITNSELRRCYKLHRELQDSPNEEFQELAKIAKVMLKFVKVTRDGEKAILQQLPAIWDLPNISQAMKKRVEEKATKIASLKAAEEAEALALREFGMANLENEQASEEILKEKRKEVRELRFKIGSENRSGEWRNQLLTAVKRYKNNMEIVCKGHVA
jgi:hypothetical protein